MTAVIGQQKKASQESCAEGHVVLHLRNDDAERGRTELLIACRRGRRFGQHTVNDGAGPVGLDSYLSLQKAQPTNRRYLVSCRPEHREQLLQCLATRASSALIIRLETPEAPAPPQEELWMIDEDQLVALLGAGWSAAGTATRKVFCGKWVPRVQRLTPPDVSAVLETRLGSDIRQQLKAFRTYGDVEQRAESPSAGGNRFVVRPSMGAGTGHPGVELTPRQLKALKKRLGLRRLRFGTWVSVGRDLGSAVGPESLSVPATLRRKPAQRDAGAAVNPAADARAIAVEADRDRSTLRGGELGVDQVIRLALGVAEWEDVTVQPMTKERRASWRASRVWDRRSTRRDHWVNKALPAVHVVARVQPAELTLTEQRACLLSALALDSLGLKSGDEVVLHSSTGGKGAVHVKQRLKAYAATEEVIRRRMTTFGGGRGAPLPSEDAAFQFGQSLPWIWVDAAVRRQLSLPDKLGAVIVAPSRSYVIKDNLREVALVAAIALTGAAIRADGEMRKVLALFAFFLPLTLIGARVRNRLR